MAVLVHITSVENDKSICQSGIKLGKYNNIVYFMPHMKEYLISHQWARELKRSGIKNFIAVDFKIPTEETIWFGKYTEGHKELPLKEAIELFMSLEDKLGYEFFIERKIEAKEVMKVRHIPKPMGWRYEPASHGKEPCPCPMCIQPGGYKTNKLKEKHKATYSRKEAREILLHSNAEDELNEAISCMKGKWRKESPEYLERLLKSEDEYLLYSLTEFISEHRHPLAIEYLTILSVSNDEDVRELSLECIKNLTRR